MLLTITTTHSPATDLGYLLHKNPSRLHSVDLSFGKAHVFYPEISSERCSAALLLEVDPIGLVRNRQGPPGEGGLLEQYVNDRPYVASSFMSVAIAKMFGTALGGRSKERSELADQELPFEIKIAPLMCRGGEGLLWKLFEPLGYEVVAQRHILDEHFREWGDSSYFTVGLKATTQLRKLLAHLYVLIPVLDDEKHYWVGQDEIDKLLRRGSGWLASHSERELIANRYLKRQRSLVRMALSRLAEEDVGDPDEIAEAHALEEDVVEQRLNLSEQRIGSVTAALKASGAQRVLDLGCGGGRLLRALLAESYFHEIVGLDVSYRAIEMASSRLRLERLPAKQRARITLLHGSLQYRDKRLQGYDAAAVVEVIEHLDPSRLRAFEKVLFSCAKPRSAILTTPNVEYNTKFAGLPAGKLRHKDHRFEWTRAEFQSWGQRVAETFGYTVRFIPVGPEDPVVGSPTQMAVFELRSTEVN
jgi:3' terminal RNA ribose 2'-O-methyltransferase Hen1